MKFIKYLLLCCTVLVIIFGIEIVSSAEIDYIDEYVFTDQVIEVNIEIGEDVYQSMIENALAEEYVMADITYNGYTFESIGIRPKGNSSLSQVAQSGGDRFSFKIDFDQYISEQSLFGLEKINLNNVYYDATYMKEELSYEILAQMGLDVPDTSYVALSINGEYFGLYLAVEDVGEEFLIENFGNADGELYKPESTSANLALSDNYMFEDELGGDDNSALIELIEEINNSDFSNFNVETYLKYLAYSTFTLNLDSYQGSMFHNYYLYNDNGTFEWIGWDYNMSLNGFPGQTFTYDASVGYLIDEPVIGDMSNYPLIDQILSNEEYLELYHQYYYELIELLDNGSFEQLVLENYERIKDYVKTDPSAFFTYTQFEEGLFSETGLISFVSDRIENVEAQLTGATPSTNNGQGNTSDGTRVPSAGMGQIGQMPGGEIPEGAAPQREVPEGFTPPLNQGEEIPEGMEPGQLPEGIEPGQAPGGFPVGMDGENRQGLEGPNMNDLTGQQDVVDEVMSTGELGVIIIASISMLLLTYKLWKE